MYPVGEILHQDGEQPGQAGQPSWSLCGKLCLWLPGNPAIIVMNEQLKKKGFESHNHHSEPRTDTDCLENMNRQSHPEPRHSFSLRL